MASVFACHTQKFVPVPCCAGCFSAPKRTGEGVLGMFLELFSATLAAEVRSGALPAGSPVGADLANRFFLEPSVIPAKPFVT